MGESMESLFRRGMISKGQSDRIGKPKILSETRVQNSRMTDFDDKGGMRDQGGIRDRGIKESGRDHIDKRQDMGSPERASGKPSKGGSVGAQRQPVRRNEIDARGTQKPDFPKGGSKARGSEARRTVNSRSKARVPKSGGYYGGGGQDTQ
jgi:hypothetical protein